jgi:UDP-N-acetylglucosamine acyltransferase
MLIHPTALIDPRANIEEGVEVGPYAIVEGDVRLGAGSCLEAQAQVRGPAIIGRENRICAGAVIGGAAQVRGGGSGPEGGLVVGEGNVFREHVTVNRSSEEGGLTRVGDRNYFMIGAHAGHDVQIGHDNTIANSVLFGGHVVVGDGCFFGGGCAFHQYVRIGNGCIVQGLSGFSLDVLPFVIGFGINNVAGLNTVGMRRSGVPAKARSELRALFALFFREGRTGGEALALAGERVWESAEAQIFLRAIRHPSPKGACLRFRA